MDRSHIQDRWDQWSRLMQPLRAWFELCRLPSSLLPAADPLAGALIAGARWRHIPWIVLLMFGTVLLHAGARALNDFNDFKCDRKEFPNRPIVSGRVGRWTALLVAIVLIVLGWAVTSLPGRTSQQIAIAMVCCIPLSEFLMKGIPIAKTLPSVSRALGLFLGMSLVPWSLPPGVVATNPSMADLSFRLYFCATLGVYVLGVTILAYRINDAERVAFVLGGAIMTAVSVAMLAMTQLFFDQAVRGSAVIWIVPLLAVAGVPIALAILWPSEAASQRAAWRAALGVCILETAMVTFVRGPWWGLPVIVVLGPVIYARYWLDEDAITSTQTGTTATATASTSTST